MSDNSSYTDLAQRIEESFAEIEDEAISDFRETDEEYNALYQQILRLKENNPFIRKVIDGNGEISLTAEEHEVLTEYFRLRFRLDDMERQRLYFRGHTDCISYLKKVGAL
ncbi:MAG TPA: hypothetical protein DHV92_00960 [Ruminococcaceae bacterium]|nr:hypothetical protein [Oscillospiraceae bacterium]